MVSILYFHLISFRAFLIILKFYYFTSFISYNNLFLFHIFQFILEFVISFILFANIDVILSIFP